MAGDGKFMFCHIYLLYAQMMNKQEIGRARSQFLEKSLLQGTTDMPQNRERYESVPGVLVAVIKGGKGYKHIHKICTQRPVAADIGNTPKALAFLKPYSSKMAAQFVRLHALSVIVQSHNLRFGAVWCCLRCRMMSVLMLRRSENSLVSASHSSVISSEIRDIASLLISSG